MREKRETRIKGIIPPILTPFYEDESVNYEELRNQVNRMIEAGVHGLFPFGTNGEAYALSNDEKIEILKVVVDETKGRVPVYAGTGCITTKDTIELSLRAKEAGADILSIITPYFAAISQNELYAHYKEVAEAVDLPIDIHTHYTSGVASMTYLKAVEAGADMIDTAMSPFSMGTSQPATEVMVETFKGTPYDTGLDQEKLAEIADYFRPMREEALKSGLMNTKVLGVDINTLRYQVPGGMLSNLVSQLKEARAEDKYYDVLKEIPRVRKDFGEPPLVTPSSQIVGTQAVLNVLMGERYKMFTKESKKLLMGEFGQTVKPFDKEVQKKAIGDAKPITCRPADLIEPQLEKIEAEMKQWKQQDEDVLTYALFPQVAKEFFESRPAKKPPVEKREILKAAAPDVKKAPVSTEEMDGNGINTWAGRKSESYQI